MPLLFWGYVGDVVESKSEARSLRIYPGWVWGEANVWYDI